jgi:hypothetical protein
VRTGADIGQLTYSHTNELPNFQSLVNHDNHVREFAYSEDDKASLNAAKAQGWQRRAHEDRLEKDLPLIGEENRRTHHRPIQGHRH